MKLLLQFIEFIIFKIKIVQSNVDKMNRNDYKFFNEFLFISIAIFFYCNYSIKFICFYHNFFLLQITFSYALITLINTNILLLMYKLLIKYLYHIDNCHKSVMNCSIKPLITKFKKKIYIIYKL